MNSKMAEYLDGREIATLGLHTTQDDYETTHEVIKKTFTKHQAFGQSFEGLV